jgi:predicted aspartyl protease
VSTQFNPASSLIIIRGDLEGPSSTLVLRLALDTGSSHTVIDRGALNSVGSTVSSTSRRFPLNTRTGSGTARQVIVSRFAALGQERVNFSAMTYRLSPQLRLDGILGLDFLRGHELTIDFRHGLITLA